MTSALIIKGVLFLLCAQFFCIANRHYDQANSAYICAIYHNHFSKTSQLRQLTCACHGKGLGGGFVYIKRYLPQRSPRKNHSILKIIPSVHSVVRSCFCLNKRKFTTKSSVITEKENHCYFTCLSGFFS